MGRGLELWLQGIPEVSLVERFAVRAEDAGWDGISLTDSQNLVGDPFVAMAVCARATTSLRFMTGVTNAATRHPAALATVAATVQEFSGGRVVLGIGRGDTALFHLGRPPQPVAAFSESVRALQAYLAGDTIDAAGRPSRLRWLDRAAQPKVPLDVAAAGPKVLALGGAVAERVTLAVGADPARIAWARDLVRKAAADAGRPEPSIGAYVQVGSHPDLAVARDLVKGALAAFLHFSAMPGSTGAGIDEADRARIAELGEQYDSNQHLLTSARHSGLLTDELVDRYAVVGDPERCVERLLALADLGLERFVVTGATLDADRDAARVAGRLLREQVLPALRAA
jgi:5,10-methylenetetrahydromethanopterin reductase